MEPAVECPRCGGAVRIGLPRGAEVMGVAEEPGACPPTPGEREKRREVDCENGHRVHVAFAF